MGEAVQCRAQEFRSTTGNDRYVDFHFCVTYRLPPIGWLSPKQPCMRTRHGFGVRSEKNRKRKGKLKNATGLFVASERRKFSANEIAPLVFFRSKRQPPITSICFRSKSLALRAYVMSRTINVYAASVGSRFGQEAENFGDNLMADLLEGMFGLKANYVKHGSAELLGVGSILDSYYRRKKGASVPLLSRRPWRTLHVWGSGFMNENSAAVWPQRLKFHAVRGPLTAARVKQRLPLGDPALLLPRLWPMRGIKQFAVGIIPHFATLPLFRDRYASSLPKGWQIIDLLQKPKEICELISACDVIVSSSLHGLIVADAYVVPSRWVAPENSIKGDGFKFRDYEAQRGVAFSPPVEFHEILSNGIKGEDLTVSTPSNQLLDQLVSSFPFK